MAYALHADELEIADAQLNLVDGAEVIDRKVQRLIMIDQQRFDAETTH